MVKVNWLVVVLCIALCFCIPVIFSNKDKGSSSKSLEDKIRRDKDSLTALFNSMQARYEIKKLQLDRLEAELVESRAVIQRSEQKLSELLKRERHAQIENKRLIQKYGNYQLDSAFMAMYPVPDSVRR